MQGVRPSGSLSSAWALASARSAGTSYTLDSIAYKTFTVSAEELQAATLKTLTRMDMPVHEN